MRLLSLALAAMLLAAPAMAQQQQPTAPASPAMPTAEPHPGTPEVQAPVPEVGAGRGAQPGGQVPGTTEPHQPTGTPTAPTPQGAGPSGTPTPIPNTPAPQPFTDRGQLSADELELQRTLQGGTIHGRITIPNQQAAVLIQPEGRAWRNFHNVTLAWVGGVAVCGMLLLLTVFYLARGRIMIEGGPSGRTLQRFNLLERANHWMVATSFIVLGLSGLNLTFGRHLLLPLIGPEAFTAVAQYGKIAHNFIAFPFTLGLVVMLLLWLRDNIPNRRDITWFRMGGGFIGKGHPAATRFNAGQKMVFWITILGGGLVATSGYFLIFPFWGSIGIADMQLAHMVHSILAVLMIAAMLAHIYIGTIGMEGAIEAMSTGQVDLAWAKEHHSIWVEEEMAKAREIVTPPGARPAGD